jgi:hypothetical protein
MGLFERCAGARPGGGLANGWPYVRHTAATSAASSMPAKRATGEDLEREQRITGAPSGGKFPQ